MMVGSSECGSPSSDNPSDGGGAADEGPADEGPAKAKPLKTTGDGWDTLCGGASLRCGAADDGPAKPRSKFSKSTDDREAFWRGASPSSSRGGMSSLSSVARPFPLSILAGASTVSELSPAGSGAAAPFPLLTSSFFCREKMFSMLVFFFGSVAGVVKVGVVSGLSGVWTFSLLSIAARGLSSISCSERSPILSIGMRCW